MTISWIMKTAALGSALLIPAASLADFSYQETTQITGGSMLRMIKMARNFSSQARNAGEPTLSTIYLKGNQLTRVSPEMIELIDLDKETITHVDLLKHTYSVMTFEQMREQLAKASQEMQKNQAKDTSNDVKMSFDVKVRNTGAEKSVSGLSAHEAILTMTMTGTDQKTQQTGTMAVTNDMWLTSDIAGYDEVRAFYTRMAEKMGIMLSGMGMNMSRMLAQNPGATQAFTDMAKEMQKIKGVPVMQVMRMGTTADGKPLPAASEAPLPQDNSPAMPSASDVAKQSAASMLSSRLGGFGGFGRKKKDTAAEQPAADSPQGGAPPQTQAVLIEMQMTSSNFSTAPVDASHFQIPAGFKQVQPPTK